MDLSTQGGNPAALVALYAHRAPSKKKSSATQGREKYITSSRQAVFIVTAHRCRSQPGTFLFLAR